MGATGNIVENIRANGGGARKEADIGRNGGAHCARVRLLCGLSARTMPYGGSSGWCEATLNFQQTPPLFLGPFRRSLFFHRLLRFLLSLLLTVHAFAHGGRSWLVEFAFGVAALALREAYYDLDTL